jgi:hypothetical protein
MEYLAFLSPAEPKITIVNNKGQSIRSIASSHDVPQYIMDRIVELEKIQQRRHEGDDDSGWWNFRKTHTDGLEYGDLDPRFFNDRPIRPSDTVTEHAINPTTKGTRKGGFARRNPEIVKERTQRLQKKQQEPQKKELQDLDTDRNSSGLTTKEELEWKLLWNLLQDNLVGDLSLAATTLSQILKIGSKYRRPWIPECADSLLEMTNHRIDKLDALFDTTKNKNPDITKRQIDLLGKIRKRIRDGNGSNDNDDENIHNNSSSTTSKQKKPLPVDLTTWNTASSLVEGLSIKQFEGRHSTANSKERILCLPNPPVLVDSVPLIEKLLESLMSRWPSQSDSSFLIAIDAEWYDVKEAESALSTVQLAFYDKFDKTHDHSSDRLHTYVVDLTIQNPAYVILARKLVQWILYSKDLLVLGFAILHDLHMLKRFLDDLDSEQTTNESTFLDIQQLLGRDKSATLPGLKACAARYSDIPLSKTEQCSSWGARPLRLAQIDYAGLDAAILLVILSEYLRRKNILLGSEGVLQR